MAVLADEGVDEARLAGIRTAHDGEAGDALLQFVGLLLGQHLEDVVEQVARARARGGADAEGVAQTQLIEVVLAIEVAVVVGLVGHEHDRQLRAAQNLGHVHVPVGHAVLDVAQEEHQVGLLRGDDDLLADLLLEDVVRVDHPAARVDDGELTAVPLALAVLAVARRTGLVAHDGLPALCQSVE